MQRRFVLSLESSDYPSRKVQISYKPRTTGNILAAPVAATVFGLEKVRKLERIFLMASKMPTKFEGSPMLIEKYGGNPLEEARVLDIAKYAGSSKMAVIPIAIRE